MPDFPYPTLVEVIRACAKMFAVKSGNKELDDKALDKAIDPRRLDELKADIFENLGRAFAKINKPDSSTWAFKEGLKILPESENLLWLAAWSTAKEFRNGNAEKLNEQLYFLERLLEINPDNIEVLEKMSDAYRRAKMYDEQIVVLDQWLKIDGTNKKAITNKKEAFESLGKDASEVDQERWEKEIEYGNSDKKVKELVNYWKNFKKMPLSKKKTSKKRDAYMVSFNNCQLWWKQNPKKFKEKWL